jgi:hypothetical protein
LKTHCFLSCACCGLDGGRTSRSRRRRCGPGGPRR